MTDTGDDFYSLVDAESAISGLEPDDLIKLRLFARSKLVFKSLELTEDELISEALTRTLEGARRWNKDLGILEHLIGTMRSIATDQRRTKQVKAEILTEDVESQTENALETVYPDASALLESEQSISIIFKAFEEDNHAAVLIQGLFDGEKRRETLARTRMSEKEYGAARKRIFRKLVQMQEKGQI